MPSTPTSRQTKANNNPSDQWAFNLRTQALQYDSSDSEPDSDSEDVNSDLRHQVSEDAQLLKDLDLSSRQETVDYKPNPWNIAKINAVSRPNPPSRPKIGEQEAHTATIDGTGVGTMVPPTRKLKSPKGRIVDSFKKQAQRPAVPANKCAAGAILKPGPQLSILAPVTVNAKSQPRFGGQSSTALSLDSKNKNLRTTTGRLASSSVATLLHQSATRPRLAVAPTTALAVNPTNDDEGPIVSRNPTSSLGLPSASSTTHLRLNTNTKEDLDSYPKTTHQNSQTNAETNKNLGQTPHPFAQSQSQSQPQVTIPAFDEYPLAPPGPRTLALAPVPASVPSNGAPTSTSSFNLNPTLSSHPNHLTISFSSPVRGSASNSYATANTNTNLNLNSHLHPHPQSYSSPARHTHESSGFVPGFPSGRGAIFQAFPPNQSQNRNRTPTTRSGIDFPVDPEDDGVEVRDEVSAYMRVNNPHQSSGGGVSGDVSIGVDVYDDEGMVERRFAPPDQGTFVMLCWSSNLNTFLFLFILLCFGLFRCHCAQTSNPDFDPRPDPRKYTPVTNYQLTCSLPCLVHITQVLVMINNYNDTSSPTPNNRSNRPSN